MKYKEFNQILEEYKKMAEDNRLAGNDYAANACEAIIEDLKLLLKQGILGQFPNKKEKK